MRYCEPSTNADLPPLTVGDLNSALPSGPATVAVTSWATVSPFLNTSGSPWSMVTVVVVNRSGGAASTVLSARLAAGPSSAATTTATTALLIAVRLIPAPLYSNVRISL